MDDLRPHLLAQPNPNDRVELAAIDTSGTPCMKSRKMAERQLAGALGDELSAMMDMVNANRDVAGHGSNQAQGGAVHGELSQRHLPGPC